jgi:hypothetical protein
VVEVVPVPQLVGQINTVHIEVEDVDEIATVIVDHMTVTVTRIGAGGGSTFSSSS